MPSRNKLKPALPPTWWLSLEGLYSWTYLPKGRVQVRQISKPSHKTYANNIFRRHRGGKIFCKFPIAVHMVDLNPVEYLIIDDASNGENEEPLASPEPSISEADEDRPGVLLNDSDASLD